MQRLRRIVRAWDNALELARAGRLTAPYGAAFELVHAERVYRLRRYPRAELAADAGAARPAAPLLLVPPLMVTAEVYDISPDVSAVAYLAGAGVDVWLVDFGAPEREAGGMSRTLDDHVRAVSEAAARVRAATGRDVHLTGYSQGGMFCYQAAAFRRGDGIASIVALGSPVDLHRALRVDEGTTERLVDGLRSALAWPLAHIDGLPGVLTSVGFKLVSARKELGQLVDFVKNLHDREALEKREAKRLFLGGDGFVAWPGPAFRKFVDELVVGNRLASGGFVIDGHTVALADIACPILYAVGSRDEMARPAAVRGIRRACPRVRAMYELPVAAGHFGLVVGSAALAVTWPSVVDWMRWCEGLGDPPSRALAVPTSGARAARADAAAAAGDDADDAGDGLDARGLVDRTARFVVDRLAELSQDLGAYLDSARYQLPRLARLRHLQDDTRISLGKALADQTRDIPDRTFFLFRGRAFGYADASRRVDAVVRGLVACGIRVGDRVGVMMGSRPSQLSVVTAINRIGAVAVLLSPAMPDELVPRALALGEAEILVVDPGVAARARAAVTGRVLVLGGAGEVPWQPGARRALPAGVVDLEAIDPEAVALPAWYRPDPGRAGDLAMVFVSEQGAALRAVHVTNRRWAFSALGAAAAATLTTRDTIYCCLPLHHPSGALVATGSALVSGARLALGDGFADRPDAFWDEVRRYGASVVYYAGEMCRQLVDAPPALGDSANPVRLFAGSGLRAAVWRRLVDRFGPVSVLEMYASTEASLVLANARGGKLGSVGRPLPGSPEVAVVAWSTDHHDFERDGAGRLVRAGIGEPGMLIASLGPHEARAVHAAEGALAALDRHRILRDVFAPGDCWFVTGDLFRVDAEGDHWFVDRRDHMIAGGGGSVASTAIEDAIYEVPGIALCAVVAHQVCDETIAPDGFAEAAIREVPIAAIQLRPGAALDLDALSRAVAALPEPARPERICVVAALAMTDGFRPIKHALRWLDLDDGPDVVAWDAAAGRYRPTAPAPPPAPPVARPR